MKVLVLGGSGQVARAVAHSVPMAHSIDIRSRTELDISNESALSHVISTGRPDWIVNCAAYTAVDRAEQEPELAFRTNDSAVGVLARAAAQAGCRLMHLSTDFVFNGESNIAYLPTDLPQPLSVYGASKLAGEKQALTHGHGVIVLRTAWVYAANGKNFVLTMLRLLNERDDVRVVSDQIGTPTWAGGLAQAIWGLISAGAASGVYHWTDLGLGTWYDFASAIQDEALARGLLTRRIPIVPISTSEYPTPAVRPAFSVLDTRSTRLVVAYPAQHWRNNLRKMLDELRAA